MNNPLSSIIKKGEQLIKNITNGKKEDGINDQALRNQINDKRWVHIAVEKVNKGELWREWFKPKQ
ncbi:hypothetical protein ACJ2A9_10755 [Anaerobacillus sp. MEB173]|uniref:hypothetical protein n=1 Tax=Anaerobacillus sp. MEB173 TaxID=3383345 RepID=UPI003F92225D